MSFNFSINVKDYKAHPVQMVAFGCCILPFCSITHSFFFYSETIRINFKKEKASCEYAS